MRQSHEFLQSILDSLPAHIAVIDAKGVIVMVNQAWRRFGQENGLDDDEACVGMNYLDVCRKAYGSDSQEAERAWKGIRGVLEHRWSSTYLEYPCHGNGQRRWFGMHVNRLRHGDHNGAITTHLDISARKLAEKALEYESAVEAALSAIHVPLTAEHLTEGEMTEAILNHARRLTASPDGFVSAIDRNTGDNVVKTFVMESGGKPLREDGSAPVFRKGADGQYPSLLGISLNQKRGIVFNTMPPEISGHTPPGHMPIRRLMAVPVLLEGEPVGQIVLANKASDYTERDLAAIQRMAGFYALAVRRLHSLHQLRDSENRYRNLVEGMPAITYLASLDDNSATLYISPQVENILGIVPDVFLADPDIFSRMIHPDDREGLREALRRTYRDHVPLSVEYRMINATANLVWIRDDAHPLMGEDGRSMYLQGVMIDITRQKEAEAALLESRRQVELARNELESRVRERTNDLDLANRLLKDEIRQRIGIGENLRRERDRIQQYLDIAGVIFLVLNVDGAIRMINRKGLEILGYPESELLGKNWFFTCLSDEDRPLVWNLFKRIMSGEPSDEQVVSPVLTRQGERRVINWHNAVIHDREGEIVGTLSSGEDITERLRAEKALNEKHTELTQIFEAIPDAMVYANLDRRVIRINRAFTRLIGYEPEEVLGRETAMLYPNREEFLHQGELRFHSTASRDEIPYEMDYRHKNGELIICETVAAPVRDSTGATSGYLAVVRDIRKRKEMERILDNERRRLSLLFDSLPAWIILLDQDLRIRFANRVFRDIFGEPMNRFCYQVLRRRDRKCEGCLLLDPEKSSRGENELVYDDRVFQVLSYPFIDVDESPLFMELGIDITEKKTLQAEAIRAHQLASLGEMAAGVAHEINNPVNGIINYAQILLDECGGQGLTTDLAQRIGQEGERIAHIVKNLLSFARDAKEERNPVAVSPIIADTLSLMAAQLRKDGVAVRCHLPEDLPGIFANAQQMRQVFLNLLSNARYALNQKFPEFHPDKCIDITGEALTREGRPMVRLTFLDRGTGIPPEVMERIFHPFFTTKPTDKGTGLGLSISHGIIRDHGGDIRFESARGEFTRAIIDLPSHG